MKIKFQNLILKNQFNLFLSLSFFFIFLSYNLTIGYIESEELADKFFLISIILIVEILYLVFTNKYLDNFIKKSFNHLSIFLLFLMTFVIWNNEVIYNYSNLILLVILNFLLIILLNFFIKTDYVNKKNFFDLNNILLLFIINLFLSGIFYNFDYLNTSEFLTIFIISFLSILLNLFFTKINFKIDLIVSLFFFLILSKVFLFSSIKDPFHYSWYLGSINAISNDYKLLEEVVSQYGFLNILLIQKLSLLTNLETKYLLTYFIIFLFISFFIIFLKKIIQLVNLSKTILVIFLSCLIFGNIGFSNLDTAIFIPSSSVFRFLPSIITILIFSNFFEQEKKISYSKIIIFQLSFLISVFWSFESLFFTLFSLITYFIFKFFFNIREIYFNIRTLILSNLFNKKFFFLILVNLSILFLFFQNKEFTFFYEYALHTESSLSEKIINNKITLLFIFVLFFSYIILRDSFFVKSIFYHNILWFSLFVSFSTYFLIRSVDNNVFNLFPFFIFIICSMKINSNFILYVRQLILNIIILFTIVSTLYSVINNKDKFIKNLLYNDDIVLVPNYLDSNYIPDLNILNTMRKYKNLPVTFISGKTIHDPNLNLNYYGYGLPILPLEQFNLLNLKRKQYLMNKFFNIKNKHLILCNFDCSFYRSNDDGNYFNKIFLTDSIKIKKISESSNKKKNEYLYLLYKN